MTINIMLMLMMLLITMQNGKRNCHPGGRASDSAPFPVATVEGGQAMLPCNISSGPGFFAFLLHSLTDHMRLLSLPSKWQCLPRPLVQKRLGHTNIQVYPHLYIQTPIFIPAYTSTATTHGLGTRATLAYGPNPRLLESEHSSESESLRLCSPYQTLPRRTAGSTPAGLYYRLCSYLINVDHSVNSIVGSDRSSLRYHAPSEVPRNLCRYYKRCTLYNVHWTCTLDMYMAIGHIQPYQGGWGYFHLQVCTRPHQCRSFSWFNRWHWQELFTLPCTFKGSQHLDTFGFFI